MNEQENCPIYEGHVSQNQSILLPYGKIKPKQT